MKEIHFYHILANDFDKVVCRTLRELYADGVRILVKTSDLQTRDTLSALLWTFSRAFIPHGTSSDPFPEEQPILITHNGDNLNNSSILVLVGADHDISSFERVVVMFSDYDDVQKTIARQQYKMWSASNSGVVYSKVN